MAEWVTRACVRFTTPLSTTDSYSNNGDDFHASRCADCTTVPMNNNNHNTDWRRTGIIQDRGYEWYDTEDSKSSGISQKTAQEEEEGPTVCIHGNEWGRRFLRPWAVGGYFGDREQRSSTKGDVEDGSHGSAVSSPATTEKIATADTVGGSCNTTPHSKREYATCNLTQVESPSD